MLCSGLRPHTRKVTVRPLLPNTPKKVPNSRSTVIKTAVTAPLMSLLPSKSASFFTLAINFSSTSLQLTLKPHRSRDAATLVSYFHLYAAPLRCPLYVYRVFLRFTKRRRFAPSRVEARRRPNDESNISQPSTMGCIYEPITGKWR